MAKNRDAHREDGKAMIHGTVQYDVPIHDRGGGEVARGQGRGNNVAWNCLGCGMLLLGSLHLERTGNNIVICDNPTCNERYSLIPLPTREDHIKEVHRL